MQNATCRVIEPNGKIAKKELRTDNVQNQLADLYEMIDTQVIQLLYLPKTKEYAIMDENGLLRSNPQANAAAQRYVFEQTGQPHPLVGNIVIVDAKYVL